MLSRLLTCILCAALCISVGCAKKKKSSETNALLTQMQTTAAKDSGDIFDEFYDNTAATSAAAAKPAASQPTFSTATTSAASTGSVEFSPDGNYVIQVSCVKSSTLANRLVKQLEEKGYPAYVAEVDNPTPDLLGTFYRVRIGGFTGVSKARSFGDNILAANGFEYWVDNRSNDNVGLGGSGMGSGSMAPSYSSPAATSSGPDWGSAPAATSSSSSSDWGTAETTQPPAPAAAEPAAAEPAAAEPAATEPAPAAPATSPTTTPTTTTEDDWGSESSW